MKRLVQELLPANSNAIHTLLSDEDTRHLMRQELGKILQERDLVVAEPFDQILVIVSQANFADSDDECTRVAGIICRLLKDTSVLPAVHMHRGMDLASRCLISLGMFRGAMEFRHHHHGAPAPVFYRQVGIHAFEQCSHNDIAEHFQPWENFLSEMFAS